MFNQVATQHGTLYKNKKFTQLSPISKTNEADKEANLVVSPSNHRSEMRNIPSQLSPTNTDQLKTVSFAPQIKIKLNLNEPSQIDEDAIIQEYEQETMKPILSKIQSQDEIASTINFEDI